MVSFRNVNLRSRPGRQDIGYHVHYTTTSGRFLATEDGEDSAAGLSQRTYLAESSAEVSAEHSRRLATPTKKKKQRGQSTVEAKRARREQEFNSRKHVLEILHKPGI